MSICHRTVLIARSLSCFWLASLVWLAGCARTQPSKFYTLNAAWPSDETPAEPFADSLVLGVGPVNIPAYMERPQMVTRVNSNEVLLSEFNRWAEPVTASLPAVLEGNLNALLPGAEITDFNLQQHLQLTHQLVVDIDEFIGTPGGSTLLRVKWMLVDLADTNNPPVNAARVYRTKAESPGYDGLAASMSALLQELSEDIVKSTPALAGQARSAAQPQ